MKKRDLNDCSFVHLTLILLLHYLVKCRSMDWPFITTNSYWVAHAASENHCKTTKLSKMCYLLLTLDRRKAIVPRSRTSTNWNGTSTASEPLWVTLYWICCWRLPSKSTSLCSCWRWTFWAHALIKMMWC